MKYFTFSLSILVMLLTACSKSPQLETIGAGFQLKNLSFGIDHINDIEWGVGNHRATKVSQGVVITFKLPKLDSDDVDDLMQKFEIDSWIFRVKFDHGNTISETAIIMVPFKPKSIGRVSGSTGAKSFSINLSYAAATHSERFRRFQCPAFNHRKKIDDYDIKTDDKLIDMSISELKSLNGNPKMIELTPLRFNMGESLQGTVLVEAALYSYKMKAMRSAFYDIGSKIVIEEENVAIPECEGVHPETTTP